MRALRLLLVVLGVGAFGGVLLPLLVAGETPVASGTAGSAPLALGAMATPSTSPSEKRAVQLLRRAAAAGQNQAYSGTQSVTSWSRAGTASVLVDVQHMPGKGTVVRIDGGPSTPSRGGRQSAMVNDPATAGIDKDALSALEVLYVLRVAGTGRCAGRLADIVQARRASTKALTAQFWIDRQSGLLLRRELYDTSGHTVRAAAFFNVHLGPSKSTAAPSPMAARRDADGAELGVADLRRLRRAGWAIPQSLPGALDLFDARMVFERTTGDTGRGHGGASKSQGRERVLHLSYSDGLFTISVFEQRGRLDTDRFSGWNTTEVGATTVYTQAGLSERAVWSGRDRVYTVVADAPDAEISRTVKAFPHEVSSDGFLSRVDRGFSKMAAWFN